MLVAQEVVPLWVLDDLLVDEKIKKFLDDTDDTNGSIMGGESFEDRLKFASFHRLRENFPLKEWLNNFAWIGDHSLCACENIE